MIISQFPSGAFNSILPVFTYSGSYAIVQDFGGWKIEFHTSGTFVLKTNIDVDIFCVGGGGNGSGAFQASSYTMESGTSIVLYQYGGGGGGGYTATEKDIALTANTPYSITVGVAGQKSSFSTLCQANPGEDATSQNGGDGGSGGAQNGFYRTYENGVYYGGYQMTKGGKDGANSEDATGQGTTTREFGEPDGKLYASGGNAYGKWGSPTAVIANTGNGGHGRNPGSTAGASGIVIIRNAR